MSRKTRSNSKALDSSPVSLYDVSNVLKKVPSLNLQSAETYLGHLKLMSKDNNQPDIRKLMEDYEGLAQYIANKKSQRRKQPLALQTIRSYFVALNSVAMHYKGLVSDEAKSFYQKKQDEFNEKVTKKMGENEVPEKFGDIPPSWDEVEEILDKFKGTEHENTDKHLILAFYVLIPPRRSEYRTLIYLDKRPSKDNLYIRDKKHKDELRDLDGVPFNYIFPNSDGTYHMVLRNYKTDGNHGAYETDLPKDLSDILKTYLENTDVLDNTVVFRVNVKKDKKGGEPWRPLKSGSWSTKLTNAIKEVSDRPYNMDDLRHTFISDLPHDTLTTNEKDKIAKSQGHSRQYQCLYRRFIRDNNNDAPEEPAPKAMQIDLDIKMATLAMLKSQTEMFTVQTEYLKAKARALTNT